MDNNQQSSAPEQAGDRRDVIAAREFPTAVIASLSSGVLLCEFGKMHEAAEFLMGHPIWTHHFANKDLWQKMQRAILEQCPGMPTDLPGVNADNYRDKVAELEVEFGAVALIRKGNGSAAMHPLEGIPEGKKTIVISAGPTELRGDQPTTEGR